MALGASTGFRFGSSSAKDYIGLAAAVAGTRLLRTMLFQAQSNDRWDLAVAAMFGVVTLVASCVRQGGHPKSIPYGSIKGNVKRKTSPYGQNTRTH